MEQTYSLQMKRLYSIALGPQDRLIYIINVPGVGKLSGFPPQHFLFIHPPSDFKHEISRERRPALRKTRGWFTDDTRDSHGFRKPVRRGVQISYPYGV